MEQPTKACSFAAFSRLTHKSLSSYAFTLSEIEYTDIPFSRNYLLTNFYCNKPDCSHILMIDSDRIGCRNGQASRVGKPCDRSLPIFRRRTAAPSGDTKVRRTVRELFDAVFTGSYDTKGYAVTASVGHIFELGERTRFDLRGGLLGVSFRGDPYTDSGGNEFGKSRLSFGAIKFEPASMAITR
ncbi:autotransporter outer membrane beta-barrel domain-containing protein [Mesorhizobium sp.]|uniref:autotransporter outer membrane beta-barrel domain-containing protein n=1 Tax=Mesorhizobium sp. TaxID=1871066 RepID=UPI0025E26F39|nr:autotransporter outer membrane beta-barrel domain-containing protein [Mesorhizobium sp.]